VSVKETSVCIVDDTGKIVQETRVASEIPGCSMASIWNNRPKFQLFQKFDYFLGETPKGVVPSNLDRGEGTCLESAVDLLIPRPS
jgi:hypothetical protein